MTRHGNRTAQLFGLIGAAASYVPSFVLHALDTMTEDPQLAAQELSHYSYGPSGRRVGKRLRMTCRPQSLARSSGSWPAALHTPKHLRPVTEFKFKGKQPMVLSKKEHSFMLANRLPGGVLMQPWQVKACLSKYSAETPASFA